MHLCVPKDIEKHGRKSVKEKKINCNVEISKIYIQLYVYIFHIKIKFCLFFFLKYGVQWMYIYFIYYDIFVLMRIVVNSKVLCYMLVLLYLYVLMSAILIVYQI